MGQGRNGAARGSVCRRLRTNDRRERHCCNPRTSPVSDFLSVAAVSDDKLHCPECGAPKPSPFPFCSDACELRVLRRKFAAALGHVNTMSVELANLREAVRLGEVATAVADAVKETQIAIASYVHIHHRMP